jgi:Arc/MetJ-type ribon-helix-helix transcriptional regulator
MTRLPQVITVRLDENTLARIRERVGEGFRARSLSQFIREGIRLRLDEPDEYTGWLASRRVGQGAGR